MALAGFIVTNARNVEQENILPLTPIVMTIVVGR